MRLALILLFTCSSQAETLKLTLEQARELALNNHPSLAALDYSARAAAELPKQIRSTLSPQLSGGIAGSVADDVSRLVFSGLNSSLLTTRIGGGLQLNQLITPIYLTTKMLLTATKLRSMIMPTC